MTFTTVLAAINAWRKQPTTVAGISTLAGTGAAVLSGAITWQTSVPIVLGALVAAVLPDNAGAAKAVQAVATDLLPAVEAAANAGAHGGATAALVAGAEAAAPIIVAKL